MATNTNPFYTYSATAGSSKTLQKPQDGGDNNQWGNYINTDLDEIVSAVNALSDKISDASENTLVDFTATGSAVNHVGITNAAAGNGPTISAAGSESNVDLNVTAKGTGDINLTPGTNGDVNIPSGKGITFGDDGEKIEGDGTDLTIASSATLNVNTGSSSGNDFKVNTSQLVVEGDTGNVGVGQSAPVVPVHIGDSTGTPDLSGQNNKLLISKSGGEAKMTLFRAGTPANGTTSGEIVFGSSNSSGDAFWWQTGRIRSVATNTLGGVRQGNLVFSSSGTNGTSVDAMTIESVTSGSQADVTIETGNLIIGTAGKGIDFSNQTHSTSYTPSSEVLDHYEEGSITSVTISGSTSGSGSVACSGSYTKVGRLVTLTVNIANQTFPTFSGQLQCSLPFAVGSVLAHGPDTYYFPQSNWDQHTNWVGMKAQASAGESFCVFPYIVLDSDRQSVLTSANTVVSGTSGLYLAFSITYQSA